MSKQDDGDWAQLEAAYPCVLEEQFIAKQESLGEGLTENDLLPRPILDYPGLTKALDNVEKVLRKRDTLMGLGRFNFSRALDGALDDLLRALEQEQYISHRGINLKAKLADLIEAAASGRSGDENNKS